MDRWSNGKMVKWTDFLDGPKGTLLDGNAIREKHRRLQEKITLERESNSQNDSGLS